MNPLNPTSDPRIAKGLEALGRDMAKAAHRKQPFYNEENAAFAKDLLDQLHKREVPIKVLAKGMSVKTLRLKYYQGKRYLIDNLDPNKYYNSLSNATKCATYRDYIELHIKGEAVIITAEQTPWKEELLEFLSSSKSGQKFHKQIIFSLEEMEWINSQLTAVKDLFIWKVEQTSLLVINYDNKEGTTDGSK